jgi:hypothetical protein
MVVEASVMLGETDPAEVAVTAVIALIVAATMVLGVARVSMAPTMVSMARLCFLLVEVEDTPLVVRGIS